MNNSNSEKLVFDPTTGELVVFDADQRTCDPHLDQRTCDPLLIVADHIAEEGFFGMLVNALIIEYLDIKGTLKTFKMYPKGKCETITVAFADEYDEDIGDSPFFFLDNKDGKRFRKQFAKCQARRLTQKNFRRLKYNTYEFNIFWQGIPVKDNQTSYYALSLPQYSIPSNLHIIDPRSKKELNRSVIKDTQNKTFIIYVECVYPHENYSNNSNSFDFRLDCQFSIDKSKFTTFEYKDDNSTSYAYPDSWKNYVSSENQPKVEAFLQQNYPIQMNFYGSVSNVANNVEGNQATSANRDKMPGIIRSIALILKPLLDKVSRLKCDGL